MSTPMATARRLARGHGPRAGRGLAASSPSQLRDSRRAALVVGIGCSSSDRITGRPEFADAEARASCRTHCPRCPPPFRGMLGEPINLGTLGGFLSWRCNFLPIMLGLGDRGAVRARSPSRPPPAAWTSWPRRPARRDRPPEAWRVPRGPGRRDAHRAPSCCTSPASASRRCRATRSRSARRSARSRLYGLLMLASGSIAFATGAVPRPHARGGRRHRSPCSASYLIYVLSRSLSPALDAISPISWYAWTVRPSAARRRHRLAVGGAARASWPSSCWRSASSAFDRRDIGARRSAALAAHPGPPARAPAVRSRDSLSDLAPGRPRLGRWRRALRRADRRRRPRRSSTDDR